MPEHPHIIAYQLRGMATMPGARKRGLGRALVQTCLSVARENAVQHLWCNARTSAVVFYLKLGFEIIGHEFYIPDVGPHLRMSLKI